jgi:hypothetical protein
MCGYIIGVSGAEMTLLLGLAEKVVKANPGED